MKVTLRKQTRGQGGATLLTHIPVEGVTKKKLFCRIRKVSHNPTFPSIGYPDYPSVIQPNKIPRTLTTFSKIWLNKCKVCKVMFCKIFEGITSASSDNKKLVQGRTNSAWAYSILFCVHQIFFNF